MQAPGDRIADIGLRLCRQRARLLGMEHLHQHRMAECEWTHRLRPRGENDQVDEIGMASLKLHIPGALAALHEQTEGALDGF